MTTKYVPIPEDEFSSLELQSTLMEIKSFMRSSIYQDYLKSIELDLNELTLCLDDPELKYSGRDYDKFRGAKDHAKRMKDFFVNMLEAAEEHELLNEEER